MSVIKELHKSPRTVLTELLQEVDNLKAIAVVGMINPDKQDQAGYATFLTCSFISNAEANWLLDRGKIMLHNSEEMESV